MVVVLVAVIVIVRVPVAVIVGMRSLRAMRVAVIVLVVGVFQARCKGHLGRRLGIQHLPHKQHDNRAQQREQRNEPDLIEKVHAPTT